MKIRELFGVAKGSCHGLPNGLPGNLPVVSGGIFRNGVVSFVDTLSGEKLFKVVPCLSVVVNGQGGTMLATLRTEPFYATDDVEVLTPNDCEFWKTEKFSKLVAIAAFLRKQRWRFGWGRKGFGRVASIPLDMVSVNAVVSQIHQSKPKAKTITQAEINALLGKIPKGASIQDLFEVLSCKNLAGEDAGTSGAIPFVSASEINNGVTGFVNTTDTAYLLPGGTLSVAKDGKPMVSRVQTGVWAKNSHAVALTAKGGVVYTDRELAILAALIENQTWRYSYGRAAGWERMGPQVIT